MHFAAALEFDFFRIQLKFAASRNKIYFLRNVR